MAPPLSNLARRALELEVGALFLVAALWVVTLPFLPGKMPATADAITVYDCNHKNATFEAIDLHEPGRYKNTKLTKFTKSTEYGKGIVLGF